MIGCGTATEKRQFLDFQRMADPTVENCKRCYSYQRIIGTASRQNDMEFASIAEIIQPCGHPFPTKKHVTGAGRAQQFIPIFGKPVKLDFRGDQIEDNL